MSSLAISVIVLACVFGGAGLGLFLRAVLPRDRLRDSENAIKLGLVTTMSATVIVLDRVPAAYGLETNESTRYVARLHCPKYQI
jgi:ABC-type proline/glycine betaine transport system permease subunit